MHITLLMKANAAVLVNWIAFASLIRVLADVDSPPKCITLHPAF